MKSASTAAGAVSGCVVWIVGLAVILALVLAPPAGVVVGGLISRLKK